MSRFLGSLRGVEYFQVNRLDSQLQSELLALMLASWQHYNVGIFPHEYLHDKLPSMFEARWKQLAEQKEADDGCLCVFTARKDGKVVGLATAQPGFEFPAFKTVPESKMCYLTNLHVDAAHGRRGIGGVLLDLMGQEAVALGQTTIYSQYYTEHAFVQHFHSKHWPGARIEVKPRPIPGRDDMDVSWAYWTPEQIQKARRGRRHTFYLGSARGVDYYRTTLTDWKTCDDIEALQLRNWRAVNGDVLSANFLENEAPVALKTHWAKYAVWDAEDPDKVSTIVARGAQGQMLGFVVLLCDYDGVSGVFSKEEGCCISNVHVDPTAHRHGIGRHLMDLAADYALFCRQRKFRLRYFAQHVAVDSFYANVWPGGSKRTSLVKAYGTDMLLTQRTWTVEEVQAASESRLPLDRVPGR